MSFLDSELFPITEGKLLGEELLSLLQVGIIKCITVFNI